jgi:hypothetical protein
MFKQELLMEDKGMISRSDTFITEFNIPNKAYYNISIPILGVKIPKIADQIVKTNPRYFDISGVIIECNYVVYSKGVKKRLKGSKLSKREMLYSIWTGTRYPDVSYLHADNTLPPEHLEKYLQHFKVEKEFWKGGHIMFTFIVGDIIIRVDRFKHQAKQKLSTGGILFVIESNDFILVTNHVKISPNTYANQPNARLINVFEYLHNKKQIDESKKRVVEYVHNTGITPATLIGYLEHAPKGTNKHVCSQCKNIVDRVSCVHNYSCIGCCTYSDTNTQCPVCFPGVRDEVKGCYYDYNTKRWVAKLLCVACRINPATENRNKHCTDCYNSMTRLCEQCGDLFTITRAYSTMCRKCYYSNKK